VVQSLCGFGLMGLGAVWRDQQAGQPSEVSWARACSLNAFRQNALEVLDPATLIERFRLQFPGGINGQLHKPEGLAPKRLRSGWLAG
jgi:hypothetical protein